MSQNYRMPIPEAEKPLPAIFPPEEEYRDLWASADPAWGEIDDPQPQNHDYWSEPEADPAFWMCSDCNEEYAHDRLTPHQNGYRLLCPRCSGVPND